jgi:hypothetical protein
MNIGVFFLLNSFTGTDEAVIFVPNLHNSLFYLITSSKVRVQALCMQLKMSWEANSESRVRMGLFKSVDSLLRGSTPLVEVLGANPA